MRSICLVYALPLLVLICCGSGGHGSIGDDSVVSGELRFPVDLTVVSSFASAFYRPVGSTVEPSMEPVGFPVEASEVINLDEIIGKAGLEGPPADLTLNGFKVFQPLFTTDDPVRAFQICGDWDQPVYVSSGIPLHLLHIFFDQILQSLEEDHFHDDLVAICRGLYQRNLERECSLNAAFYAVPLSILDRDFVPDASIADDVLAELQLIEEHAGFFESPVMGYREDYSQYVPRGHYTAGRRLENYFRAMMWLGRLTFLLNGGEPNGPAETYLVSMEEASRMTSCALFTVSDLGELEAGGESLLDKWLRIYEITAFFAGFADDLSVPEYAGAGIAVAGSTVSTDTVMTMGFYGRFRDCVNENYAGPSIYSGTGGLVSMPDPQGEFDPADLEAAFSTTAGFRFMGQRYTPDSEILGKLVFPAVGSNGAGERRFMPSGLDVAAAFGSEAALGILEENGEFGYAHYGDSLASMREMIESYGAEDWHSTLYMSWLHCLYLLMAERGEGYPDFMMNESWKRHTLSNFLASWAMLRHDTILYAKQSYTMEAGCAPGPSPSAGFVEPVPEVYAQLNATLEMARRGLAGYGVLDGSIENRFDRACGLMTRLQAIAEGELAGQEMSREDADFLKGFAGYLEAAICWDGETTEGLETTLIADVHTDQNSGRVLEVASGRLDCCIVIYRRPDGYVEAAAGPVLSYYEFTWPMGDRLTDEAWREMLDSDPNMSRPSWTEVGIRGEQLNR